MAQKMIGGGMMSGLSKSERRPAKKHLRRISVERAANGGFNISHDHVQPQSGPYVEGENHVFSADDHAGVMNHLKKHLGLKDDGAVVKAAEGDKGKKAVGKMKPKGEPQVSDDDDDGE